MNKRVSVLGLGYVGSVTAACLANQEGVSVIGVDKDANKTEALAAGRSPVIEPGLDDLVGERRQRDSRLLHRRGDTE